jgi:putative PIN family toxin of toxin-antitoxin system
MIVVLDTNIIVSALINPAGAPGGLVEAALKGRIRLCSSERLWGELNRALGYPDVRRAIARRPVEVFEPHVLERLRKLALFTPNTEPSTDWVSADPDDNWVVQCALDGQADMLVTGDRALLALGMVARVEILRANDALRRLGAVA